MAGGRPNAAQVTRSAAQHAQDRPCCAICAGQLAGWLGELQKTSGATEYKWASRCWISISRCCTTACTSSGTSPHSRSQKNAGHKARRVKQGGFTSGRRGIRRSRVSNAISRNRSCRRPDRKLLPQILMCRTSVRILACDPCMPFRLYAILQVWAAKSVSRPLCEAGNRGRRRCASNAGVPPDR